MHVNVNRDLESFTLHYPGIQIKYEVEDEYYLKHSYDPKKGGGGPKRKSKDPFYVFQITLWTFS